MQGAVNHAGSHGDPHVLPLLKPVKLEYAPAKKSLSDLIEEGFVDATLGTSLPESIRHNPNIARLFPDYVEAEKDYYKRTGIYPIMHTVVIRRDVYERNPWVALNLYQALCAAKDACYRSISDAGSPKASFAWLQPMIEEEKRIIGDDWYPYGIEKNRPTLEALLQYTHEHGLTDRRLKIEDIFAPSTMRDIPLGDGQHT